jgi:hypothetical protein
MRSIVLIQVASWTRSNYGYSIAIAMEIQVASAMAWRFGTRQRLMATLAPEYQQAAASDLSCRDVKSDHPSGHPPWNSLEH